MPEVTLSQGTVRYRETAGEGTPVVFVHGFLVNHRLWEGVQDELERRGVRSIAPDLPLGSHPIVLGAGAERSPRGVARLIAELLAALDLRDVTLVGNDTGGALCQFVLDTDASRVGRVLLTNCDGLDVFPPKPFDAGAKVARLPGVLAVAAQTLRSARLRASALGFGVLSAHPIPAELTDAWTRPLRDRAVRADARAFLKAVRPADLLDVSTRLSRFPGPVRLCWAPEDRFFTIDLGRRLQAAFDDAELVEIPDSRTFVPLDQPVRLADELVAFGARAQAAAGAGGSSEGEMAPAGT